MKYILIALLFLTTNAYGALELAIPNKVASNKPVIVDTTDTVVNMTIFDFDKTEALAIISYGTKDEEGTFTALRQEQWKFSGQFYYGLISKPPVGNSIAEALLGSIAGVITQIQLDSALKQSLLDSGELAIF